MYCSNCGSKVNPGGKFCSSCGTPVNAAHKTKKTGYRLKSKSGGPLLVTKPTFIPWVTIVSVLPIQIFFTIWAGFFFGGLSLFAVQFFNLKLPAWSTFIFFGILFFFGIPVVFYIAKKNTYAKTEYRFFQDKLEYYEGFFTVEEKSISYKNIVEVNLRQGIIQKKYGLGTILLSTPATGHQTGVSRSGKRILDIKEPRKIYKKVKELIDQMS